MAAITVTGVILVVMLVAGYLLVGRSGNTRGGAGDLGTTKVETSESVRESLKEAEDQMLEKIGSRDFVEQARALRADLDSLEEDVAIYKKYREDPVIVERAQRVMGDIGKDWLAEGGAALLSEDSVKRWRDELDSLILAGETAVSSKKGGDYEVSGDSRESLRRIQSDVKMAKSEYTKRRQLGDALASMRDAPPEDEGSDQTGEQNRGEMPSKGDSHEDEQILQPSSGSQK